MCELQEIDARARAAAAVIEAWQGPLGTIRTIWKLEDVIMLLTTTIDGAGEAQRILVGLNGQPTADDAGRKSLMARASYFLETLQRLRTAAESLLHIVDVFEVEKFAVTRSGDLQQGITTLSRLIERGEELLEELEWEGLEAELIPGEQLLKIQDYLRSTGQASA